MKYARQIAITLTTIGLIACGGDDSASSTTNAGDIPGNSNSEGQNEPVAQFGYPPIRTPTITPSDDIDDWYNLYWYDDETDPPAATLQDYLDAGQYALNEFNLLSEVLYNYASNSYNTIESGNPVSDDPLVQEFAESFHETLSRTDCAEFEGGLIVSLSCNFPGGNRLIYVVPGGGKVLVEYNFLNTADSTIFWIGNQETEDPLKGYGVQWRMNRGLDDNTLNNYVGFNQIGPGINTTSGSRQTLPSSASRYPEAARGLNSAGNMMRGLRTGEY